VSRTKSRHVAVPPGCMLAVLCVTPWLSTGAAQTTQPVPPPAAVSAPSPKNASYEGWNPWKSKHLTGNWGGLRDDLKNIGIDFSLRYQHQIQQNVRGGLDTHNAHRQTGSYDAVLKLDFEKMRLLEDTGLYFKWKATWSESDHIGINADKVGASGAARVNSDAEDDEPIFVKKWWLWKKFLDEKVEIRLGNIETKKDLYDVSLYANHEDKDFLNRLSFQNATIPHRTGIGVNLAISPCDWFYFQMGAFDAHSRAHRTGFDTAFHDNAWFVSLWEFGFTPKWPSPRGPMPGRYRAGIWYDPRVSTVFENRKYPSSRGDDVGFYIGFDQMIWKENTNPKDSQGLGFFSRYGHAHRDINKISDYWSAGFSYKGLIPTRDKDVMAFGVAQAIFSAQYRHNRNTQADRETVYEWYYTYYVTPWLNISPDVQIITNPGGRKDVRDAVVAGLRLQVTF